MGVMQMNEKARQRKAVCEMVKQRRIKLTHASEQCSLSYRQMLRVYEKYLKEGDAGLIHQSRGQRSNRKHPHREEIIAIYRQKYDGFGPTLASEYLFEEDGLSVNHETLRQWLLAEGLWKKQRNRNPYRSYRECKAQFGELIQIDGSIHDWFNEGKHTCLLNLVDDATGKSLARLADGETTRVLFQCMWAWIKCYGIPLAVYVDLKNVYVSPKEGSLSHFQRACEKLNIRVIKARSPQAKGRVERKHALYQDRLVKALKLHSIKTLSEANRLLENGFVDKLNDKFERKPKHPKSAHRMRGRLDLNQVLCWEYERVIQHDWTFSFEGKRYQVLKTRGLCVKPKSKVIVRKHLEGGLSVWHEQARLSMKSITQRPKKTKIVPLKRREKSSSSTPWHKTNSLLYLPKKTTPKYK